MSLAWPALYRLWSLSDKSDSRLHSLADRRRDIPPRLRPAPAPASLSSQIRGSVGRNLSVGRNCFNVLQIIIAMNINTILEHQQIFTYLRVSRPTSACVAPDRRRCTCPRWLRPGPARCRTPRRRRSSISGAQTRTPSEPESYPDGLRTGAGTPYTAEPGLFHKDETW